MTSLAITIPVAVVGGALGLWVIGSIAFSRHFVEQWRYTVLKDLGKNVQIRRYPAQIVAEVDILNAPDFRSAQGQGFRKVAGFIFGNNIARGGTTSSTGATGSTDALLSQSQKVSMTSPVLTTPLETAPAQKISMTSPVITTKQSTGADDADNTGAGNYRVAFVMPSKYTSIDQLPVSKDPAVRLRVMDGRVEISYRTRGGHSAKSLKEGEAVLREAAAKNGLRIKEGASPMLAGYDPPFIIPFMRRSEVSLALDHEQE